MANWLAQEFLAKIEKVSNEEFDQMTGQFYEELEKKSNHSSEKQVKETYLEHLVSHYLQSFSQRVFQILIGVPSPFNESLFNILMSKISATNNSSHNLQTRQSVLILISNIIHRSPTWLPNIINLNNSNILSLFFSILKNDQEVVILGTSALILVELIATLPSVISECLEDIFVCFSRLSTFLFQKLHNEMHKQDEALMLHLNSIVYRLFIRLYAMYPCNFFNFLKLTYGSNAKSKENNAVFCSVIQPMLSQVRFHPLLITASKDKECEKSRWFYKETHDILDECGQYAIDPIEFYPESELVSTLMLQSDDDKDEDCYIDGEINTEVFSTTESLISKSNLENEVNESNSCTLVAKLNEDIDTGNVHQIALLSASKVQTETVKCNNAEFAQEAILLTKPSQNNLNHNQKVIIPVAISAGVKDANLKQRKCINKTHCFSPFEPIKDLETVKSERKIELRNEIPSPFIANHSAISERSTGSGQMHVHNDNEEVDMEIVSYNLEDSQHNKSKQCASSNFEVDTQSKNEYSSLVNHKLNYTKQAAHANERTLAAELVGNIKKSLKKANSRIRYQSHCLAETDNSNLDGQSSSRPNSAMAQSRALTQSCPLLYFGSEGQSNCVDFFNEESVKSSTASDMPESNETSTPISSSSSTNNKGKVNFILQNPDCDSKRKLNLSNRKKVCKSVDITKEAKLHSKYRKMANYGGGGGFERSLFLSDTKYKMFDTCSSTETINRHTSHRKFTPHELLDKMLSINSEFCHRKLEERCRLAAEQSDGPNNTATSIPDWIGILHPDDMRKQLAIMYAQLLFERHQRDAHVIRNRRLYKQIKKCFELEETNKALEEQLKSLETNCAALEEKLKINLSEFSKSNRELRTKLDETEIELDHYKKRLQQVTSDKDTMERLLKEEMTTLHQTHRATELELNTYLSGMHCKQTDLAKLEVENFELKSKIFKLCEFYNKLKEFYTKKKCFTDLSDQSLIEALERENNEMRQQLNSSNKALELFKDKCFKLEAMMKHEEEKKSKHEINELDRINEALKMKDKQIETLNTIIINYDTHIRNLKCKLQMMESQPNGTF